MAPKPIRGQHSATSDLLDLLKRPLRDQSHSPTIHQERVIPQEKSEKEQAIFAVEQPNFQRASNCQLSRGH